MVELTDREHEVPPVETGRLNERDLEALRHLAEGRSIAEVAAAMSISRNTVRTRLRRVQSKLAASGRDDIVRRARDHGLL